MRRVRLVASRHRDWQALLSLAFASGSAAEQIVPDIDMIISDGLIQSLGEYRHCEPGYGVEESVPHREQACIN